ncbi:MAG: peptidoglycan-binding protein [Pseudomonadota bacterium]
MNRILDRIDERMGLVSSGKRDSDTRSDADYSERTSDDFESQMAEDIRARRDQLDRQARRQQTRSARPLLPKAASDRASALKSELQELRNQLNAERKRSTTPVSASDRQANADPGVAALRQEVEALRRDVTIMAREETVRDLANRWSSFETEFAQLPDKLGSRDDLMAVAARVDDLTSDIRAMPASLPLDAMEHQLRVLAESLERVAHNQTSVDPGAIHALNGRLDEISRAISVIPSHSASANDAAIGRLEQKLHALAEAIEAREMPDTVRLEGQLGAIAGRIDEVATTAAGALRGASLDDVHATLADLTAGISSIASRPVESANAGDRELLEAMAARLDKVAFRIHENEQTQNSMSLSPDDVETFSSHVDSIADRLERGLASQVAAVSAQRDNEMLHELGGRLDEFANRVEQGIANQRDEPVAGADTELLGSIAARLDNFAAKTAENETDTNGVLAEMTSRLERRFDDLATAFNTPSPVQEISANADQLDRLEKKLGELGSIVGALPSESGAAVATTQVLEDKIAHLTTRLELFGETFGDAPSDDHIARRLDALESEIKTSQKEVIAAARQSAENAVATSSGTMDGRQSELLDALARQLAELERSSHEATERNSGTFEAIHDTLIKVVDHLANLEDRVVAAPPYEAPVGDELRPEPQTSPVETVHDRFSDVPRDLDDETKDVPVVDAPPLAFDEPPIQPSPEPMPEMDMVNPGPRPGNGSRAQRMAPEKAAQAAAFAALNNDEAISGPIAQPSVPSAPVIPQIDDEVLAPGSGAPNLAAIIQQVRDEGAKPRSEDSFDSESAKSDFIAAARRAAKAAVADTSVGAEESAVSSKGIVDKVKSAVLKRKKPIAFGAVALLLATVALPLVAGMVFGGGSSDVTDSVAMNTVEEPSASVAAQPNRIILDTDGSVVEQTTEADQTTDDMVDLSALVDEPSGEIETAPVDANFTAASSLLVPEGVGSVALREAVQTGDPKALFVVAQAIIQRSGSSPEGLIEARAWYQQAAELGYAPAQYRIANFFEKGTGGEQDYDQARLYYQLAAEQGNASAMHNLGSLTANPSAGEPDLKRAAEWFHNAAELGIRDSQFNLGVIYGQPDPEGAVNDVPQDLVEAYKWFALAANQNDELAAEKRDEVAAVMDEGQLETARGAAELWQRRDLIAEANIVEVPDAWSVSPERVASTENASVDPAEMKKAIRNIQAILNNAGYDAGPVDGLMGEKTRNSIITFQRENGLTPNGIVDEALVQKLLQVNERATERSS